MFFVAMRLHEPLDLNRRACNILSFGKRLEFGNLEHLFLLRRWRVWKYEKDILDLEIESTNLEKNSKQGRGGIIVRNEDIRRYQMLLSLIEIAQTDLFLARRELAVAEAEILHRNRKERKGGRVG